MADKEHVTMTEPVDKAELAREKQINREAEDDFMHYFNATARLSREIAELRATIARLTSQLDALSVECPDPTCRNSRCGDPTIADPTDLCFTCNGIGRIPRDAERLDVAALLDWINDANRKPSGIAFTDGPERQVADLIETAMSRNAARLRAAETLIEDYRNGQRWSIRLDKLLAAYDEATKE